MVHLNDLPKIDGAVTDNLAFMCTLDNIVLSSLDAGILSDQLRSGVMNAYITADPQAKQRFILLKFFEACNFNQEKESGIENPTTSTCLVSEEKALIVLLSTSKAWPQGDRILIFPKPEGGLWKVDCTHANEQAFNQFQDMLTYFMNYENRHHMKNTLATIDPITCKVTKILAEDVHLDNTEMNTILDLDDFISAQETKKGQKLPVYVDKIEAAEELSDLASPKKVKLLYQSGDVLVTSSDWLAQTIVFAGNTLAKGISYGSKYIEERIEPTTNPLKLKDPQRRALEIVHQTTCTANHIVKDVVDMTVSTALSAINILVHNRDIADADKNISESKKKATAADATRHFGLSAIQAALKIAGGVASAASAVATSSREGAIQMLHKRYGQDAGFLAEKTLGSGSKLIETIIYFDSRGICRSVVVSGVNHMSTPHGNRTLQTAADTDEQREVVFDNEWPNDPVETKKDKIPQQPAAL